MEEWERLSDGLMWGVFGRFQGCSVSGFHAHQGSLCFTQKGCQTQGLKEVALSEWVQFWKDDTLQFRIAT